MLAGDAAFSQIGELAWVWKGADPRGALSLAFDGGTLSTQGRLPRSPDWLQALRRIAVALDARVHGEEGEELTQAESGQVGGLSMAGSVLVAAVAMPVMLLVLVLRLPWLLWKLWRATR